MKLYRGQPDDVQNRCVRGLLWLIWCVAAAAMVAVALIVVRISQGA